MRIVYGEGVELGGEWLPINGNMLPTNPSDPQGCYFEMLEALNSQLEAMLSHHSRVLVVRVDLKVPAYTPGNTAFSNFMRKLVKKLRRHTKGARVGYLWAREQEKAKRQHYHLALFLDHHQFPNARYAINHCIEPMAEAWEWPKPYTPKNCFSVVSRGDWESKAKAFYRVSYLCKVRGKGYKAKAANNYGRSNIKPKAGSANNADTHTKAR